MIWSHGFCASVRFRFYFIIINVVLHCLNVALQLWITLTLISKSTHTHITHERHRKIVSHRKRWGEKSLWKKNKQLQSYLTNMIALSFGDDLFPGSWKKNKSCVFMFGCLLSCIISVSISFLLFLFYRLSVYRFNVEVFWLLCTRVYSLVVRDQQQQQQ